MSLGVKRDFTNHLALHCLNFASGYDWLGSKKVLPHPFTGLRVYDPNFKVNLVEKGVWQYYCQAKYNMVQN